MPFINVMLTKSYMGDDGSFEKALSEISLCFLFVIKLGNSFQYFLISSGFNTSHYNQTHKLYDKRLDAPPNRVFSKGKSA